MHDIGAGLFVGVGIPKVKSFNRLSEPCADCKALPDTEHSDDCQGGCHSLEAQRVNTFTECDCCGAYHRTDFNGDCREDSERYYDLPDDARIVEREDN